MLSATHGASHEGRGVTPMHGSKVIIYLAGLSLELSLSRCQLDVREKRMIEEGSLA